MDSKHLNANSNNLKGIRSIRMPIQTIRKGFEAFECKFQTFERDSKHSNQIQSIRMKIQSIRMQNSNPLNEIRSIYANSNHSKMDLKNSNANSNHSKGIRSIRMQILTIRKGFEGFEASKFKFDPFERDSMQILNIRNGFEAIERKFKPFERDSKHSNANSYHSKGIRSI